MPHLTDKHHRRTIRLQQYDYRWAGAYYVTICTHQRECTLGEILDGHIHLSTYGQIAQEEWLQTAVLRPYILLDVFVIMPNHLHGIIINTGRSAGVPDYGQVDETRERFSNPVPHSLSAIIRSYKSAVTRRINDMDNTQGRMIWQGRFYDHVISNDADLQRIREYITANPARWQEDENNLHR